MVHHRVGVFGYFNGIPDKRNKGDKEGMEIVNWILNVFLILAFFQFGLQLVLYLVGSQEDE